MLSHRQRRAIALLVSGLSKTEAARRLNVRRETVSVWATKNPEFRAALARRAREVFEALEPSQILLYGKAQEVASESLDSDDRRVRAAMSANLLREYNKVYIKSLAAAPVEDFRGTAMQTRLNAVDPQTGEVDYDRLKVNLRKYIATREKEDKQRREIMEDMDR